MAPKFFASALAFRKWLEANHEKKTELLVGFHKVASGTPSMTWPESVDEALSFGWIDGVRKRIDESSYTIRFTPRKRTSIWSAVNVKRVAELTRAGRMRPAGLAAFAARSDAKTAIYSFDRKEAAKLEPAHEALLRANPKAAAFFDRQPPGYQRITLHWVTSAKKAETRERRLAQLIEWCAEERRLAQFVSTK